MTTTRIDPDKLAQAARERSLAVAASTASSAETLDASPPASAIDELLEDELDSPDPTKAARLFTILQRLLTPTQRQTQDRRVFLHRGVNETKRVFFQTLAGLMPSVWVRVATMDADLRRLRPLIDGLSLPLLVILDGIPSGDMQASEGLACLVDAAPRAQIHILQGIAHPSEPLTLSSGWVELYNWRNTTAALRWSEPRLWPALAAWLGIVADREAIVPPRLTESAAQATPAAPAVQADESAARTVPACSAVSPSAMTLTPDSGRHVLSALGQPQAQPEAQGQPPTAPDSASAETVLPGEPAGEIITILGVRLPLVQLSVAQTASGATLVQCRLRLVSTEDWRGYQSIQPKLIPSGLCDREVLPVEHSTLRTWGVEELLFVRLGFPLPTIDGYEVEMEGIRLPTKMHANPLSILASQAARTAIYRGAGTGSTEARLYTALGLAGEAGEVAGKASKMMRDGASPALDAALHKELGDTLWFWLEACLEWGASPDKIAHDMLTRLQDRQARGKLRGSGDAR